MSAAAPGPAATADSGTPWAHEVCPLCGAPLRSDQDWCLRCGTGARTRLAAPAKWKGLAVGLALVTLIALGVLAAALAKLAG